VMTASLLEIKPLRATNVAACLRRIGWANSCLLWVG
jgi:hypothetical protein